MRALIVILGTAMAILLADAPMPIALGAPAVFMPHEETSVVDQARYTCYRVCDRRGCRRECGHRINPHQPGRHSPPLDPTERPYRPWWERWK